MADTTTVQIVEEVTELSVSNSENISLSLTDDVVSLSVNNFAIPTAFVEASDVILETHGSLTSTNLQTALEQLADQNFRSDSTPTGSNVEEGDTWYDTDDNQLKVYRETSSGVFEWVPIMVGNISEDSDTLDAGAF